MNKYQIIILKLLKFIKNIYNIIIAVDIDWFFIFLMTFMFTINYPIYARVLGSIGISYVYKMIERTIIKINQLQRKIK